MKIKLKGCLTIVAFAVAALIALPALAFAYFTLRPPPPQNAPVVTINGGRVQGTDLGRTLSYRGIPFAAAPTGQNRWRPPGPAPTWQGVRAAVRFAPACAQRGLFGVSGREDCLYLNVWRPDQDLERPLPVVVWVHGGSFTGGSSKDQDSARLSERGLVVVNVAYRLGPLGFMAHPELSAENDGVSGNYGLLDLIASLQWVRENIAAFGGDPDNITIAGSSSGSFAVSFLAGSPSARGLFHRVIAHSGAAFQPIRNGPDQLGLLEPDLPTAEREWAAALVSGGVDSIAEARALSAREVLRIEGAMAWPVMDGRILPDDFYELYREGRYNDTPVLVGSTAAEWHNFVRQTNAESFAEFIAKFGDSADEIRNAYPHESEEDMLASTRDIFRDTLYGWGAVAWARLQSHNPAGSNVYVYYFDYDSPPILGPFLGGPMHTTDVFYLFGGPQTNPTPDQAAVSELMMSYWANFARTGNPNGPGLPQWPAFEPNDERVMRINPNAAADDLPNRAQLDAIDSYFTWRREQRRASAAPASGASE